MTRTAPEAGCHDVDFQDAYALDDAAEVALEDYAQALTRSRRAQTGRAGDEGGLVTGVHVCGAPEAPSPAARNDLEAFARDLSVRGGGGGLGWS